MADIKQPTLHAAREEWMVFADTLQQSGDPRGELIVWNDKLTSGDDSDTAARDAHLREHAAAILGEAGAHLDAYDLSWRYGLLEKASVRIVDDADGAKLTAALLSSPVAASLERLELVGVPKSDESTIELAGAVAAAIEKLPASCTQLALTDHRAATRTALTASYYDPGANLVDFGPLAGVFALEHLRGLEITTADPFQVDLDPIEAPNLRHFALHGMRYASPYDTGTELTQRLTAASWPQLESLELRLAETFNASVAYDDDAYTEVYSEDRQDEYGDDEWLEGSDWNAELAPLLESIRPLPLRRLALRGAFTTDSLLELLEQNPLPVTLDELDLSDCQFSNAEARWMADHKNLFDTLKRLVLLRVGFSPDAAKQLDDLGPEIVYSSERPQRYRFVVGSE